MYQVFAFAICLNLPLPVQYCSRYALCLVFVAKKGTNGKDENLPVLLLGQVSRRIDLPPSAFCWGKKSSGWYLFENVRKLPSVLLPCALLRVSVSCCSLSLLQNTTVLPLPRAGSWERQFNNPFANVLKYIYIYRANLTNNFSPQFECGMHYVLLLQLAHF